MRFTKTLKLQTIVLAKVEETEEMIKEKDLKRLLGTLSEDEENTINVEEATQEVSYYSIDYLAKDDNFPNRCIICSSGNEDVIEMSVEELEIVIDKHFKEYGVK
jgi:hypothetical protein